MKQAWYDKYKDTSRDRNGRPRDISRDTRDLLSKMEKGVNCRPDYSLRIGGCTKCDKRREHYEFLCPTYDMYNQNNCRICSNGHHYEASCIEKNALPAPTLNVNKADHTDDIAGKIKDMILAIKN